MRIGTGSPYRERVVRPDASRFSLDQQLCFALYAASRAMTGCYRPQLDRLGLTYPQYLVLLVLWENGETTVSGLGAALNLESGTLSPLLKRLEANGLISRNRAVDDERSVRVSLTRAGDELRASVATVQDHVERATGMSRDELVALRETLRRLTAHLHTTAARG